jgi:hypothetical protein
MMARKGLEGMFAVITYKSLGLKQLTRYIEVRRASLLVLKPF